MSATKSLAAKSVPSRRTTSGISSSGEVPASGVGNRAVISSVASIEGNRPGSARTTEGLGVVDESVGAALVDDEDVVAVTGTAVVAGVDELVGRARRSSPPQAGVTSMATTLIAAIERFTIRPYAPSDEWHQSRTSSRIALDKEFAGPGGRQHEWGERAISRPGIG
jgi:hypothetical protein